MPRHDLWFDVSFPMGGTKIPRDHGYLLFSALMEGETLALRQERDWALHLTDGIPRGAYNLSLTNYSRLTVRAHRRHLSTLVSLSGAVLRVGVDQVVLGSPELDQVRADSCSLSSRFVTVKGPTGPDDFKESLRGKLTRLDLRAPESISIRLGPPGTMHIRGARVTGYAVTLDDIHPEDSFAIQVAGLGGRRHMGGGVFVDPRGPVARSAGVSSFFSRTNTTGLTT